MDLKQGKWVKRRGALFAVFESWMRSESRITKACYPMFEKLSTSDTSDKQHCLLYRDSCYFETELIKLNILIKESSKHKKCVLSLTHTISAKSPWNTHWIKHFPWQYYVSGLKQRITIPSPLKTMLSCTDTSMRVIST